MHKNVFLVEKVGNVDMLYRWAVTKTIAIYFIYIYIFAVRIQPVFTSTLWSRPWALEQLEPFQVQHTKSARLQQAATFHGSGAQQQLAWKHSGIAQQQTELLGNSPKQQRDAQQERRAWSQLRQCGGLSTQWQNNMQQPHQQIQMEQMHFQQYTSWSWDHQHTMATMQHSMNGNTSSQHTWAYKILSTQH